MPPHCDSMDGPVVRAARAALDGEDVELVLPYVHEHGEAEVRDAFDLAVKARARLGDARPPGLVAQGVRRHPGTGA